VIDRRHHRASIRLRGYDYAAPGAYFVTIVTHGRSTWFGEVADGAVGLNPIGQITQEVWEGLPNHYEHVQVDAFVVMPNHVHGIIVLTADVGAGLKPAPTTGLGRTPPGLGPARTGDTPRRHGLPEIVRAFKTFSARHINALRHTPGQPVWQRNYYEHIIRDEDALNRIRQYIAENPLRWAHDRENPAALTVEPANAWRAQSARP